MVRSGFFGFFLCACALWAGQASAEGDGSSRPALGGGFDLIELRAAKGGDAFLWDGAFSYGDARDWATLTLEGGSALGGPIDEAQTRLFYGHAIGVNVAVLAGVRKDFKPHPRDFHAAVGVQGMIGSRLNWEGYAFLADDGKLTGEAKVVYTLPITERLYLEPRIAFGWSAQDIVADSVRSGFTEGEAAIRLRYRLTDHINIYAGIEHERLLGGTRALARAEGEAAHSNVAVIGFGFSL